jgi:hypothetical protein
MNTTLFTSHGNPIPVILVQSRNGGLRLLYAEAPDADPIEDGADLDELAANLSAACPGVEWPDYTNGSLYGRSIEDHEA